jgi:N-acetyl-alpha-D-muramate 1-phosphate uridylyltransferase
MTRLEAAFIPAAGFGTRMRPLTDRMPKALVPLNGVPMLDRAIGLVREAGIGRIVVNAHYLAGQIENHLADRDVTVSPETPDILDTGGGLKAALPLLAADPVAVLNPDSLYLGPNPVSFLADAWAAADADALLLVVPLADAIGRVGTGDFSLGPDGQIVRGREFVYTGAQILRTGPIALWPDRVFGFNPVWDALIARGRARAVTYPGRWCDLGTPAALAEAEALLAKASA